MSDFEKQVLSELAELRTQMKTLIGNGHPGRIQQIEARMERHEVFLQRAGGIATALVVLITLVHLGIDFLRLR